MPSRMRRASRRYAPQGSSLWRSGTATCGIALAMSSVRCGRRGPALRSRRTPRGDPQVPAAGSGAPAPGTAAGFGSGVGGEVLAQDVLQDAAVLVVGCLGGRVDAGQD